MTSTPARQQQSENILWQNFNALVNSLDIPSEERASLFYWENEYRATHTSPPAPEKVLVCFGNYWTCPIDELECKVSDSCHQKAIQDREEREQAAKSAREQFVEQIEAKLPRYPSDIGDMYLLCDIQELVQQEAGHD